MIHLVDSDVCIDILLGRNWAVAYHEQLMRKHAAISAMAYGEIWEGVVGSRNRVAAETAFEKLIAPFEIIPLETATMRLYGEIRVDLQRRGLQIGAPDVLIAATAIHNMALRSQREILAIFRAFRYCQSSIQPICSHTTSNTLLLMKGT